MAQTKKIHVAVVIGTRPEAIKLAPVISEMQKYPDRIEPLIISTGQHREMLDQIFNLFRIEPHYDLKIMKPNQTLEHIASNTLVKLPEIFRKQKVDVLLVQGDTSSAFAAALTGFYNRIPVGHVEAGLRSYDKENPFPEEINRMLIGPIASFNFAPTWINKENLLKENILPSTIAVTGNTVIDALLYAVRQPYEFQESWVKSLFERPTRKILLTAHRRENFGQPLQDICHAVLELAQQFPDTEYIYPVHPNPNVREVVYKILDKHSRIHLVNPLGYLPFVKMMQNAFLVLSDSGGVQEEAPSLGKPVLVLRKTTERGEAVHAGTVKLIGTEQKAIIEAVGHLLNNTEAYGKMANAVNPYGDGRASSRIVQKLLLHFQLSTQQPEEFTIEG